MKIAIGGQIEKQMIETLIHEHLPGATTSIHGDIEAAMLVKSQQADYYFGACNTGAGGALAMATALLGADKTVSLAMPSKVLSEIEIEQAVASGKIAFGFTVQSAREVIALVCKYLK